MYLCCVESLSWFQSKLDFLWIFKVTQKSGQSPCTIVHGHWPNFIKIGKERISHFYYIFWCIYMYLCCVENLSRFQSKLDFLWILKVTQKSGQSPCTIVHGHWPNFIKIGKERILHFYYIFWCIYMYLCCVESLSRFQSKLDFLWIFKVTQKSGQSPCTIVHGHWPNFIKIGKERILHFYYIFWCIYMYLCCVESLSRFQSKLDFLWIFKVTQKSGQSPCTIVHGHWPNFIKIGKERIPHFYFIFWCIYMYLCCVESLSRFQSKLDFLWILKVEITLWLCWCFGKQTCALLASQKNIKRIRNDK